MRETVWPEVRRYAIAVLAVALALVLSLAGREVFGFRTPYFLFATAVVVSAYRGGLHVGLLATVLSSLCCSYFILSPIHSFEIDDPEDALVLLLFTGEGIALTLLVTLVGSIQRYSIRSSLARYTLAILAVIIAFLVKAWTSKHHPHDLPFVLFYTAVMVAVWSGGWGPGFLATGMSAALAAFYFYEPRLTAAQAGTHQALRLMVFLLEGTLITLFGTTIFAARLRAEQLEREAREATDLILAREVQLRKQHHVLLELAGQGPPETGDPSLAVRWITEASARTLECAQVGVWLFDEPVGRIVCIDLLERERQTHSQGAVLVAAEAPAYYEALRSGRTLASHVALEDPRTRELASGYLRPLGITSLLEAPIRRGGRIVGVVCAEHVGPPREWTVEEEQFARSIADLTAVALDTCELMRAQQRIREQADLLDQARDAILVEDAEGRVSYWGKGAERLYGWAEVEALGKPLHELIGWPDDEAPSASSTDAVASKGAWTGELRQRARSGEEVVVVSRWSVVADARSGRRAILMINTDITERKHLESQLLRTQRLESIGSLTSGIAHDLGNILSPLCMGLDLLCQSSRDEENAALLENLRTCSDRGMQLVRQITAFVRGEGRRSLLDLVAVLLEMKRFLYHTLPRSIEVRVSLAENLPRLWGDSTQVYQVLLNLCVNARDAMPQGGTLTLDARTATTGERLIELRVCDTGTGIAPDVVDKIFEPFFTTKQPGKGTGLGLSTTRSLVEGMGGTIGVTSRPGEGTTFVVLLPAATGSDQGTVRARPAKGKGELVLVVDSESSMRELARRTLEADGYRVVVAASEGEALQRVVQAGRGVDAVLVNLPGQVTLDALRDAAPEAVVISSTEGASGPRPYTAEALLDAVHHALDRAGA